MFRTAPHSWRTHPLPASKTRLFERSRGREMSEPERSRGLEMSEPEISRARMMSEVSSLQCFEQRPTAGGPPRCLPRTQACSPPGLNPQPQTLNRDLIWKWFQEQREDIRTRATLYEKGQSHLQYCEQHPTAGGPPQCQPRTQACSPPGRLCCPAEPLCCKGCEC